MVALSHPCSRLPIAAAMATSTAPRMVRDVDRWRSRPLLMNECVSNASPCKYITTYSTR